MPAGTLWGFTEAQIAQFGLTFGIGAFIAYMLFIVYKLAREAKAGRFGTFVLFLVLSFGMVGFLAKSLIQWVIGI
jgi:predicted Kef-type K+ transport protein